MNQSQLKTHALFIHSQNYSRSAFLLAIIGVILDMTTDLHRAVLYAFPLTLVALASACFIVAGVFVSRRLKANQGTTVASALAVAALVPVVLLLDAGSFWGSLVLRLGRRR
jgi:predicted transporter